MHSANPIKAKPVSGWMATRARILTTIASCVVVISALAGCASLGVRLAPPTISVEGIAVGGVQGTDALVTLSLRIENPNDIELVVQSLRFDLSVQDLALTKGTTVQSKTIAAGSSGLIEVETRTNINAVLQLIGISASHRAPMLQYALEGEAIVQGGVHLRFARRGDIPLPASSTPGLSR